LHFNPLHAQLSGSPVGALDGGEADLWWHLANRNLLNKLLHLPLGTPLFSVDSQFLSIRFPEGPSDKKHSMVFADHSHQLHMKEIVFVIKMTVCFRIYFAQNALGTDGPH
jgi:hypothetical protein